MPMIQQLNMNIQNASQNLTVCTKQHTLSSVAYNMPQVQSSIQPRNIAVTQSPTGSERIAVQVDVGGFPAVAPPQLSGAGERPATNMSDTTPAPAPTQDISRTISPLPSGTLRGDEMLCPCNKQYPLNMPGQTSQFNVSRPMGPSRV